MHAPPAPVAVDVWRAALDRARRDHVDKLVHAGHDHGLHPRRVGRVRLVKAVHAAQHLQRTRHGGESPRRLERPVLPHQPPGRVGGRPGAQDAQRVGRVPHLAGRAVRRRLARRHRGVQLHKADMAADVARRGRGVVGRAGRRVGRGAAILGGHDAQRVGPRVLERRVGRREPAQVVARAARAARQPGQPARAAHAHHDIDQQRASHTRAHSRRLAVVAACCHTSSPAATVDLGRHAIACQQLVQRQRRRLRAGRHAHGQHRELSRPRHRCRVHKAADGVDRAQAVVQ